ncbi:MAG TPA: dihydroorotate dehydrogenase [Candidatus Baltobacteraceae bacterium]|nr:dihydroorotate dehydrogenase [Candidatus Baltobacteraceae bacterium]
MSQSPDVTPQNSTVNLAVEFAGIRLKNPVLTASGTFGYAQEFAPYLDLNRLGGLIVKTITRQPRSGNPAPRVAETPAGMLNAIGLQNVGVDAFIKDKLPYLRRLAPPLIVNVAGESVEDFRELTKRLSDEPGIAGIELNISCPNVAKGLDFSTDPKLTYQVVKAAREATHLPVIPKLSPNVTDIRAIAKAAEEGGASGISLINTLLGMAIDIRTRRPKIANITGGLSGPAIRPVAVRMVWQAAHAVKVPVLGMGGIVSGEDAAEFILAGATAVAVGTANFLDPTNVIQVIDGLERYCAAHEIWHIRELVGGFLIA